MQLQCNLVSLGDTVSGCGVRSNEQAVPLLRNGAVAERETTQHSGTCCGRTQLSATGGLACFISKCMGSWVPSLSAAIALARFDDLQRNGLALMQLFYHELCTYYISYKGNMVECRIGQEPPCCTVSCGLVAEDPPISVLVSSVDDASQSHVVIVSFGANKPHLAGI